MLNRVFHVLLELHLDFRLVYSPFSYRCSWWGRNCFWLPILRHFPGCVLFWRFMRFGGLVKSISSLHIEFVKTQRKSHMSCHPWSPLSLWLPRWVLECSIYLNIKQGILCGKSPRIRVLLTKYLLERSLHRYGRFAPPLSLNGPVSIILLRRLRHMRWKAWLLRVVKYHWNRIFRLDNWDPVIDLLQAFRKVGVPLLPKVYISMLLRVTVVGLPPVLKNAPSNYVGYLDVFQVSLLVQIFVLPKFYHQSMGSYQGFSLLLIENSWKCSLIWDGLISIIISISVLFPKSHCFSSLNFRQLWRWVGLNTLSSNAPSRCFPHLRVLAASHG